MEADTLTLKKVFRKDIRYVVPTFQRPYVWNQDDQWEPLWQDLHHVLELLMRKRSEATTDEVQQRVPEGRTAPHFLGAIVLKQSTQPVIDLETREVIDGQQGLITLQILLAAAHGVAAAFEFDRVSVNKLIFNDEDVAEDEIDQFKIWPLEPDQQAVVDVMTATTSDVPDEIAGDDHALHECYSYFYAQIDEWISEAGSTAERADRFDALTSTVSWLLRLVVIDLDEEDDPQVIFETLNARGTPLLAADLIKNMIIQEAEREGSDVAQLHGTYWKQFDEDVWREHITQGRLERPRIDVFLTHWLTMRRGSTFRVQDLFSQFKRHLANSGMSALKVLQDIDHYAAVYDGFADLQGRERRFFNRLDVMDTSTPMPVLLWLYGLPEEQATQDERTTAVEALESWLIRRMLCRLTTKNYNRIFMELLRAVQATSDPVDQTIIEFLANKEGESEYWPNDEQLKEAMVELPYFGRINRKRLTMVFQALELHMRSLREVEEVGLSTGLHIEHLLPQSWAHYWELPGEEPEEVERLRRDEIKHTIGNLTVLTGKLNSRNSNKPWEQKLPEVAKHTVLHLNKEVLDKWPDRWDEETIKSRGRLLAQRTCEVWPGPESDYWNATLVQP